MSKKKEQEQKAERGNRINGKVASATRYMPLYEFLMFDPVYREMKDKTKILYSFLRKKTTDWEQITQKTEAGEDGFTKSYRDENGEIYVIADNSELSIVLQCHPNRVKDFRDELELYGLLEKVDQFQSTYRLYVLTPKTEQLTERWLYIEEIKELRAKLEEENKVKAEKHRAKKAAEKDKKEPDKKVASNNPQNVSYEGGENHNQQNVSYDNSQNVSYNNQQIVGKIYSKGFKSIPEPFKPTLKESIYHEIVESSLTIPIQKILIDKIDTLLNYSISLSDIENHFPVAIEQGFTANEYSFVLAALLKAVKEKPRNFASVMLDWLNRNRKTKAEPFVPEQPEASQKPKYGNDRSQFDFKPIRTELLPDWFDEKPYEPKKDNETSEAKKRAIEEKLMAFRR